ncbi:MAG: peptidase [Ruminococcaceae bacterium]|nr:peptidase [Oscillospiraceae bacterium]
MIVTINPSWNDYAYTIADFSEIDCIAIRELADAEGPQTLSRILLLTIANGTKLGVLEAIQLLQQRSDIYCVEPNYILSVCTDIDYSVLPALEPNDPKYDNNEQWAIDKIGLPYAWNVTTGSSSVLVGVIDSGIDATHPDLANNVNTSLSRCFSPDYSTALQDASGHGTLVAGIIGAQGNNSMGVSGACWNVQLVSLRVANTSGNFYLSGIIEAINYADEKGIPILNLSSAYDAYSNSDLNNLRNAIANYDGLFVTAAGNNANNNDLTPYYPGNFRMTHLICVGGSTATDNKRSSSNYGATTVDIFAPGENIMTTQTNNRYGNATGTSMAAPYVAGVAALLKSLDPSITAQQIKYHIEEFATPAPAFNGMCVTNGRLDAYMAVCTHTYSFSAEDWTYHSGNCICGAIRREEHKWRDIGGLQMCAECGYVYG